MRYMKEDGDEGKRGRERREKWREHGNDNFGLQMRPADPSSP